MSNSASESSIEPSQMASKEQIPATRAATGQGPDDLNACSEEELLRQIAELQESIQAKQASPGKGNAKAMMAQVSLAQSRLKELVQTVTTLEGERTNLEEKVSRLSTISDESMAGFEATQQTAKIAHNALVEEVNQLRIAVQRELRASQELEPQLYEVLQLIENQARIHETLQSEKQGLIDQINQTAVRTVTPERQGSTSRSVSPSPRVIRDLVPEIEYQQCPGSDQDPIDQRAVSLPRPDQFKGGPKGMEAAAYRGYIEQFKPTGPANHFGVLPGRSLGRGPVQVFDGRMGPQVLASPVPPYVQNQFRPNNSAPAQVTPCQPGHNVDDSINFEQFKQKCGRPNVYSTPIRKP